MDPIENERATAREVISYADQQGVDLTDSFEDSMFRNDRRWIVFWRRRAESPSSGRPEDEEGLLRYRMQGHINRLPILFKDSEEVFRESWIESGTLDSIAAAFALIKAWLVDGKEVDDLPQRSIRRCGIG